MDRVPPLHPSAAYTTRRWIDPGIYTYQVAGAPGCAPDAAIVTITKHVAPDAGNDATLNICAGSAAADLFPLLGVTAQTGGTWTSSGGRPFSGIYDPATNSSDTFIYTVLGTAPCANDQASVTVTENATSDAGTNGTLDICGSDAPVNLFTRLGGTPQSGGAWTGPSATTGTYDPATMTPGIYTYTITGIAPCANASATVTVTENAPPHAGTSTTLSVCDQGSAMALLASLPGADGGGSWSGPSPVVGGQYDPVTMTPGAYVYTVTGTPPCANAQATVTVSETSTPNAGGNGTVTLCATDAAVDLAHYLTGADGGGTWSGPSPIIGSLFDPATMSAGVYTYTIAAVPPCAGASSTVTVTVNAPPNAGISTTLSVCDQGNAVALLASLPGADGGGSWSGPSPVIGGQYDPVTMTPGAYVYTVTGTPPCANAQATVTVNETSTPNAGINGTVTLCATDAAVESVALPDRC
ncbi:MAG: hypothetical protein QM724_01420 [Flavobacteriales bacterium]